MAEKPVLKKTLDELDPSLLDAQIRDRIEAAVLEIFSGQEFHKVKLIEVATRANTSLQTIYRYYGSKEALLYSTLNTYLAVLADRMLDHLQGIENYKDRLRKVYWVALDYAERHPRVAQLLQSSVYVSVWREDVTFRQPRLMSQFIQVLAEGRERGVLTDTVDEKILLDFFLGVLFRQVQMFIIRGMKEPPTANANAVFEMLWRAMAKDERW